MSFIGIAFFCLIINEDLLYKTKTIWKYNNAIKLIKLDIKTGVINIIKRTTGKIKKIEYNKNK